MSTLLVQMDYPLSLVSGCTIGFTNFGHFVNALLIYPILSFGHLILQTNQLQG